MNDVNALPQDVLLFSQFFESIQGVNLSDFFLGNLNDVILMRPVNLVDPDGVHDLQKQEIAEVRVLLDLLIVKHVLSNDGLLEGLLDDEVLRDFPKEIPQILLFLDVVL